MIELQNENLTLRVEPLGAQMMELRSSMERSISGTAIRHTGKTVHRCCFRMSRG